MRLKFLGNSRGLEEFDRGLPVPFVIGRPPPSSIVHTAVNNLRPKASRSFREMENSSPSARWFGIATSRPTGDWDSSVDPAAQHATRITARTRTNDRMMPPSTRSPGYLRATRAEASRGSLGKSFRHLENVRKVRNRGAESVVQDRRGAIHVGPPSR